MRARRRAAVFALGLASWLGAAGCATTTFPPCPAKGGSPWSVLTSAHFVVRTDLDDADADELVRDLEETRAVIMAVAWPKAADPPGRTSVIAFRSPEELSRVVPDGVGGMWVKRPPFPATLLLGGTRGSSRGSALSAGNPLAAASPIPHEVTHDLARRFLPFQPPWYAEGLATFLETLTYDRATGVASVGFPPAGRLAALRGGGRWSPEELVRCTVAPREGTAGGRFEDSSWLLFHDLVDKRAEGLTHFQELTRALTPSVEAWGRAFSDVSFEDLKREVGVHLADLSFKAYAYKVPVMVGSIEKRALRDAEVHVLRAFVLGPWAGPGAHRQAMNELSDALGQEPTNVEGLVSGFYFGDASVDVKRSLARRASEAQPTSWLAAVALADAVGPSDSSMRSTLLRALAAAPHEPELLLRLAELEGTSGRWEQALALSSRAIHLGASNDRGLLLVFAQALAHAGRCGEATFVTDALERFASEKDASLLRANRAEVARLCRPPA
jgi:hypothetical protein